jgi:hypothetical protein
MSSEAASERDCEVMAAVDTDRLLIAELCREEAWLSTPLEDAVELTDWD